MLVGKPPFETANLKDTYQRIRRNEYHIPSRVSPSAKNLIQKLLQADPTTRPSMEQVLADEFLTAGKYILMAPLTCVRMYLLTVSIFSLLKFTFLS